MRVAFYLGSFRTILTKNRLHKWNHQQTFEFLLSLVLSSTLRELNFADFAFLGPIFVLKKNIYIYFFMNRIVMMGRYLLF